MRAIRLFNAPHVFSTENNPSRDPTPSTPAPDYSGTINRQSPTNIPPTTRQNQQDDAIYIVDQSYPGAGAPNVLINSMSPSAPINPDPNQLYVDENGVMYQFVPDHEQQTSSLGQTPAAGPSNVSAGATQRSYYSYNDNFSAQPQQQYPRSATGTTSNVPYQNDMNSAAGTQRSNQYYSYNDNFMAPLAGSMAYVSAVPEMHEHQGYDDEEVPLYVEEEAIVTRNPSNRYTKK